MTTSSSAVVEVGDLSVDYQERRRWTNVVKNVSFAIEPGETLGLAGESGSGKTTTAYSLFAYQRPGSRIQTGTVRFEGTDLLTLDERRLRHLRGSRICMVPQNPASSLTPSMRIGHQVVEALEAHEVTSSGRAAETRTVELFDQVGLPQPLAMFKRYPHQLSGGQQQRVVIALALACRPKLLVLDEPTTALDVTTQARILRLLARLRDEHGMAMLYVTHNLGVLAQICDRVAVMYAGELVETAPTAELFANPRHPYTKGLIAAVPRLKVPPGGAGQLRGLLRRDQLPPGCRFAPRCDYADPECFTMSQSLSPAGERHSVACWLWKEIASGQRRPQAETSAGAA
ncbi:MAG: ABC transporter ATP-binding protein [Acidimicrobiia bacterium]